MEEIKEIKEKEEQKEHETSIDIMGQKIEELKKENENLKNELKETNEYLKKSLVSGNEIKENKIEQLTKEVVEIIRKRRN